MTARRWPIVTIESAAAIVARLDLDAPLLPLAAEPATPEQLYDALVAAQARPEAIRLLCHSLPAREAVFFALQCVRSIGPTDPADGQMLVLCERWVREPGDALGRDAFAVAERTGMKSAAAWVAIAAFWSGSSLAPPHVAPVAPTPGLAAKAASGAILFAAVAGPPLEAPARQRAFLAIGEQIATGALRPAK